ncbi:MAG: homoserine kinase [Alphaproteobacteria bacterium]|nr:homoserine kinase [Alphaproteobacteria bacterium]
MAVYTEVDDEELEAFVASYDIGTLVSAKGIAEGVENSNFLVQTTKGPWILTLYEKRVAKTDLPFFMGLMEHCAARGIACPLPIKDREGRVIRELAKRPAVIVSFLNGMSPRRVAVEHCEPLGGALARLHLAVADFTMKRRNALSVEGWRKLVDDARPRADEVRKGLGDEIAKELDFLAARWPRDLPAGVIHADLFPNNVFFLGNDLSGLIDFYFACNDFLAYDVAICLNAWCFEPDISFNATKGMRLVAGYQRVRKLSEAEIAALPLLARGAAFRFLLTRLYDWLHTPKGALVKPLDPIEYLRKLRFHRSVKSAAAYGL